jgi:ABC-2 type transport system ATP-binding protein
VDLTCSDSDTAVRALLSTYADARDIEVLGAGLDEAFRRLTADPTDSDLAEEAVR